MRSVRAVLALAGFLCLAAGQAARGEESGGWIEDPASGCAVWSLEPPQPDEAVSWAGDCAEGKANGWGVLTFWDAAGLGGRYTGTMSGGKLNGKGTLIVRDDERGGFHEFTGQFADSHPIGKGFLTLSNGTRFYGELLEGVRHGRGVVLTPDGLLARGEFKDGKGVGTLLVDQSTTEGEHYIGQWENGERQGFGILRTLEGDFYAGRFAKGLPDGPGLYRGVGGDRYEGGFANGKPNGLGTSIDAAGNAVQGRFVDGDPVGLVLVTLADGTQSVVDAKTGEVK